MDKIKLIIKQQNESKIAVIRFLVLFVIIFIFTFAGLFLLENNIRKVKKSNIITRESRTVDLSSAILIDEGKRVLNDLYFLKRQFIHHVNIDLSYDYIANEWKFFSESKHIYDQIRFLDTNGQEEIRVNLNKMSARIIPKNLLQNKKSRYYYKDSMSLTDNQFYISVIDLNIENEEIEKPLKPVIRFSTKIYCNEKYVGIIILNYLAKNKLEEFKRFEDKKINNLYMLNRKGYWISSKDPENNWTFMFDDKKHINFKNSFPNEWKEISTNEKGQIITENGLFSFKNINLRNNNSVNILTYETFKVVSHISPSHPEWYYLTNDYISIIVKIVKNNILLLSLILIISALIEFVILYSSKAYYKIKYHSEYDDLTRALNRRAGLELINNKFARYNKRHQLITFCFIDINGLKEVNDELGHEYGDELIITVSKTAQKLIRESDYLIRFGGDEFIIIFDNSSKDKAEVVWQRIKAVFDKINKNENRKYNISASHGIAEFQYSVNNTFNIDELIKEADRKMYYEKKLIKHNKFRVIKNPTKSLL